jgi:hypothetical protein
MEADDHDERLRQHEDILRNLTAMLVRMDGYLSNQGAINERLTSAVEELKIITAGVQITQASIQTMLARMIRQGENGRDA